MIFQFHSQDTIISILIRLITRGKFNHVSIRSGKYVYEAHIKKGVIKTLYSKWDNSTVVECIEIKSKREKEVVKFLNQQVGKKYDLTGIIAFLSIFAKPRKGYFYCSELAMVAFAKLFGCNGEIQNQKVSPQLFHDIIEIKRK